MVTQAEVEREVLGWNVASRAALAEKLLRSFDVDDGTHDWEFVETGTTWAQEAARRLHEIHTGQEIPIPWEEARKMIVEESEDDAG